MRGIYSNQFRSIELLIDIPDNSLIGLIFYPELKKMDDIKIFKFINHNPWNNIKEVYGFFISNINLFKSRIHFLENKQSFNIQNGIVKLPTFLTKINGEICLHYDYNDNLNWRLYKDNLKKIELKQKMCNICFENYGINNLHQCKREKCNFLICDNCKYTLKKYKKKNCPNCQINL